MFEIGAFLWILRKTYKNTQFVAHQQSASSVIMKALKCTPQETADLVTFTEEILNGKLFVQWWIKNLVPRRHIHFSGSWSLGLETGFNFRSAARSWKIIYLRLTVDKLRAFVVFINIYLHSYDCSSTSFTDMGNFKCPVNSLKHEPLK